MNNIQTWKLVTDGLLVLSLIYLCYRFARSSKPSLHPQGSVLEAELRALLREADLAARSLNDKLLKRQSKLEELLFEFEGMEGRINRAVNTFEENRNDLEIQTQKAQKIAHSLAAELSRLPKRSRSSLPINEAPVRLTEDLPLPVNAASVKDIELEQAEEVLIPRQTRDSAPRKQTLSEKIERQELVEPPSFETAAPHSPDPGSRDGRAEARWSGLNIYGEPIGAAAPEAKSPDSKANAAPAGRRPLKASVEVEVQQSYTAAAKDDSGLQLVYDAAEDLLRSGKDLQTVATLTSLPIEEIRMLSQMVAQEQLKDKQALKPELDSRLGVLGGMKRQVQTL